MHRACGLASVGAPAACEAQRAVMTRAKRPAASGVRCGFTLVELLVVVGIISVLIALLLPALNAAGAAARRVACASNLRQLGQAMMMYASDNGGNFPRGYWLPYYPLNSTTEFNYNSSSDHTWFGLRGYTDPAAVNPFGNPAVWNGDDVSPPWQTNARPGDNDVTEAMFLLLRTYNLPAVLFLCPANYNLYPDTFGGVGPLNRSNFGSPYNLGYSMALPYPDRNSAHNIGYKWSMLCDPEFAVMADLNPGESLNGVNGRNCVVSYSGLYGGAGPQTPTDPAQLQTLANSNNHDKKGQNVLYADGHVEWAQTAFAGYHNDNIYTWAGPPGVTSGLNNQWTSVSQIALWLNNRNDSMMQPSEEAQTIGRGIGVE